MTIVHLHSFLGHTRRDLVGIGHLDLALAIPEGALLLGGGVLDPDLLHVLLLEPLDKGRVPELRRDAQVLAAAHQGVGLAALDGRGELVGAEVVVLALRL